MPAPWASSIQAIVAETATSATEGLDPAEVERRLTEYGPNELTRGHGESRWRVWWMQFRSPVVLLLLAATLLSGFLGDWVDGVAIAAILVLNALMGYSQQRRASSAIEALRALAAPRAKLTRGGRMLEVASAEVVVGDLLHLDPGDYVAADARVVRAHLLEADEASLTGESTHVPKSDRAVEPDTGVADRACMVHAGTTIAAGSGAAVVTATGMATEVGRIATLLSGVEVETTPLQVRLAHVTNRLLWGALGVVVLIFALGLWRGGDLATIAMSALSLAVAAFPESLPAVVTLALALAVRRMAARNAIVRRLPAVETLGSTDVICTDKTGTLTTGRMQVRDVWLADGDLADFAACNVLCNDADVAPDGAAAGDSTETALLEHEAAEGRDWRAVRAAHRRLAEWPFDSERKRMSVLTEYDGAVRLWVKGAPESLLPRCANGAAAAAEAERLASQGRRVLAFAVRTVANAAACLSSSADVVERDLRCLGLVGLADPPRPEAVAAVAACRRAGIRVVMITGDHPQTALAVASEVGLDVGEGHVLTGRDLEHIDDTVLGERIAEVSVFARVNPEHKLRIVRAWKGRGAVTAMTGDGVNDAPALREAGIGVAMGRTGTEVARRSADMVLADDNFATVVAAVEEGRAVHENIKRTLSYLLVGNVGEILLMLAAVLLGTPLPLYPVHLLWINLVTDGLPTLALTAEPVPPDVLGTTRRSSLRSFSDSRFYGRVLVLGALTGGLTLGVFLWVLAARGEEVARTAAFTFLVFEELFRSFTGRSSRKLYVELGPRSNLFHLAAVGVPAALQLVMLAWPPAHAIFRLVAPGWALTGAVAALALVPALLIELDKLRRRRKAPSVLRQK